MKTAAVTRGHVRQLQPEDRAPGRTWTPGEILRLIVCLTACACLLMFVPWSFYLVQAKVVGPTMLGLVSGSGLLGIGGLLFKILQVALRRAA
jgi:hypothetical protein